MPLALQIESVFKNRWCGAYWQSKGLKVIPTVSWGDERSFDFCFMFVDLLLLQSSASPPFKFFM